MSGTTKEKTITVGNAKRREPRFGSARRLGIGLGTRNAVGILGKMIGTLGNKWNLARIENETPVCDNDHIHGLNGICQPGS